jgi:hypothetical protein
VLILVPWEAAASVARATDGDMASGVGTRWRACDGRPGPADPGRPLTRGSARDGTDFVLDQKRESLRSEHAQDAGSRRR